MRYWVRMNRQTYGPFGLKDLKKVPGLGPDTLVAPAGAAGSEAWRPVRSVPELESLWRVEPEAPASAFAAPAPAPAAAAPGVSLGSKVSLVVLALSAMLAAWALTLKRPATTPVPAAPVAAPAPAPSSPRGRFGLDWEGFRFSPLRAPIEACRAVDPVDMLVLYYGLRREAPGGREFDAYYPRAKRPRGSAGIPPEAAKDLAARAAALKSSPLCARVQDAARPVAEFEDRSASAGPGGHSLLGFTNAKDPAVFPSPEALNEAMGGVPPAKRRAAAYVLFRPTDAAASDATVKGKTVRRKAVRGVLLGSILVSDTDAVLATYRPEEPKPGPKPVARPAEPAVEPSTPPASAAPPSEPKPEPKPEPAPAPAPRPAPSSKTMPGMPERPSRPSATPAPAPAQTPRPNGDANTMSADELEKYLNRGK